MTVTNDRDAVELNALASAKGLPCQARLSPELSELLKPSPYLAEIGIQYSDRIKTIVDSLKENLIPKNGGPEEVFPERGIVFPLAITRGPYIREEIIALKAELTDDGGTAEILLTAIPTEE